MTSIIRALRDTQLQHSCNAVGYSGNTLGYTVAVCVGETRSFISFRVKLERLPLVIDSQRRITPAANTHPRIAHSFSLLSPLFSLFSFFSLLFSLFPACVILCVSGFKQLALAVCSACCAILEAFSAPYRTLQLRHTLCLPSRRGVRCSLARHSAA